MCTNENKTKRRALPVILAVGGALALTLATVGSATAREHGHNETEMCARPEAIKGTDGPDILKCQGGFFGPGPIVCGFGGDDVIIAEGRCIVFGGDGDDRITGGGTFYGGAGKDVPPPSRSRTAHPGNSARP